MRKITQIFIHCSATRPTQDVGVDEIRRWHTALPPDGNGWSDVGYHDIIRRDGTVERGRPYSRRGAGVSNHNENSIHICMVGGVDNDLKPQNNFTDAQMRALEIVVERAVNMFPGAIVLGHRDAPGVTKACPSFDAADWWKKVYGVIT